MQFQVTDITFDFDDDSIYDKSQSIFTEKYFQDIMEETLGSIWEADDGDDLIDEISTAMGWCIKSIDYRAILV